MQLQLRRSDGTRAKLITKNYKNEKLKTTKLWDKIQWLVAHTTTTHTPQTTHSTHIEFEGIITAILALAREFYPPFLFDVFSKDKDTHNTRTLIHTEARELCSFIQWFQPLTI